MSKLCPAGKHAWVKKNKTLRPAKDKLTVQEVCRMCETDKTYFAGVLKKYGLTQGAYERILAYQAGVCAICRNEPKTRRLAIDHDHVTGKIRGLLCLNCNHYLLGYRKRDADTVSLLRRAADYVQTPTVARMLLQYVQDPELLAVTTA